MTKKKFVQVGTGGRAQMYYSAIATTYKDTCELCAICDVSSQRMDFTNKVLTEELNYHTVPTYNYTEFDKMIEDHKPDYVIVTSVDRTHHTYIVRAMELGCNVITEKPMTIDEKKAQEIIDTAKRTGKRVRVTFNYRYAPYNTKMRELIENDTIGEVFSIHFEWLLNTSHGADYYRRWHRNKSNSGGLLVHKSTHHFDLVNFWLNAQPKTVFAFGERNFYGIENAEKRGVKEFYYRSHGSESAKNDPFAIDLESNKKLKGLYLDAEKDSGYIRDLSVFGDGISIEDTMGVIVKYNTNAILTYSLNTYMPWEGFIVSINGSKGRIEYKVVENVYINAGGKQSEEGSAKFHEIYVHPMFGEAYKAEVITGEGGHGGGDPVMLDSLFGDPAPDKFNRAADQFQGAMSILTGIAANKSIASGMPVKVADLIKF